MEERVTVTRSDDGGYSVTLDERTITLPAGSKRREDGTLVQFGTPGKYIEVDAGPYEFSLVTKNKNGKVVAKEVIVAQGDPVDETALDSRGELYGDLETAWSEAAGENPENPTGGRRSRLKKQTRRAKRNTRNNKRRKLRKLTTRRR